MRGEKSWIVSWRRDVRDARDRGESHTLEPTLDVSSALTAAAAIAAVAVTGLAERWTPGVVLVSMVRSDHGKRERADN